MMIRIKLFLLVLFSSVSGMGQSGYFGSKSSVELSLGVTPSFRRVSNIVKVGDDDVYSRRLRLANLNYSLGYSLIVHNKVELGIGFEYARMRSFSTGARVMNDSYSDLNFNLFEDVIFKKSALRLKSLFYIKGSKSPLGKYIGFSTSFGVVSSVSDSIRFGVKGGHYSGSNLFNLKNEISSLDAASTGFSPVRGYFLALRGAIGRNYPITKKILLNLSFDFPITSFFMSGLRPVIGQIYALELFDDNIDDIMSVFEGYRVNVSEGDIDDLLIFTAYKYNRIRFEIGLKYQL